MLNGTTVRVFNRNKFEHKEMYHGRTIIIPPGEYVEMDYSDALLFLGKMFPPKFDKGGMQIPSTFKWLEIDQDDRKRAESVLKNEAEEKSTKVFVCMACNKEFPSKKALIAHSKKEHADILAEENEKDD